MTRSLTAPASRYVGVDVSKKHLDVFVAASGERRRLERSRPPLETWLGTLSGEAHLVVEASGGYERLVVELCHERGIMVSVVNATRVRQFARASGKLAKTDAIDAEVIARFGELFRPPATVQEAPEVQAIRALVERRADLVLQRTAEKNRTEHLSGAALRSLKRHLRWLDAEIGRLDHDIAVELAQSEELSTKCERLRSVPGVGPIVSVTLVALLPELGHIDRRAIASLVGLAPWSHESGPRKGRRHVWGGRAAVRSALYMAALVATRFNPPLGAHYARLLERGKPKKLALIAVARRLLTILNAIVRDGTSWNQPPIPA